MASKSDVCNFALSHLGVSQFIDNIDTDRTKEARVCKKWWDTSLDFMLRDTDWNFNRRYLPLAPLSGDVPSHWIFKYSYPSDCMQIRAIMTPGIRYPLNSQRIPYEIATETINSNDVKVIYTDQDLAVARYSKRVTDISLCDVTFVLAHSYLLASLIAMPLTVKPQIASAMRDAYNSVSSKADAANYNEAEEGVEAGTELDLIRNG